MISVVAIFSIAVFLVALHFSGALRAGVAILPVARGALNTIQNQALGDDEKERAIQRATVRLARSLVSIVIRSAFTLAVSLVPLVAAEYFGWADIDEVIAFLSRWDVILIVSVAIIAGYILKSKLWPSR